MDGCSLIACHNGAECSFGRCQCTQGYAGSDCSFDECDLKTCLNGATCTEGKSVDFNSIFSSFLKGRCIKVDYLRFEYDEHLEYTDMFLIACSTLQINLPFLLNKS